MAQRLTDLIVNEASLVDRPAVAADGDGVTLTAGGQTLRADRLLMATGREPVFPAGLDGSVPAERTRYRVTQPASWTAASRTTPQTRSSPGPTTLWSPRMGPNTCSIPPEVSPKRSARTGITFCTAMAA